MQNKTDFNYNYFRSLIALRGLTLQDFCKKISSDNYTMTRQGVNRWKKSTPSMKTLKRLSDFFQEPIKNFLIDRYTVEL